MRFDLRIGTVAVMLTAMSLLSVTGVAQTPANSHVKYLIRENGVLLERKCPVHETAMDVEVVEIHYGLIKLDDGQSPDALMRGRYFTAKKELFPETNRWVGGGCVVGPYSDTNAEVYFCKMCREAEVKWLEGNPGIRPEDRFP